MKENIKEVIKTLEAVQAEMLATCSECGGVNKEVDIVECQYCHEQMDYENNDNASEIQNTINILQDYI